MSNNSKQVTVVVGMSGGVDSSVAALLLKKQGYNVIGLHMKAENPDTAKEDEMRVHELCECLGIECVVVDYSNQMQTVKDYFIAEYKAGRTPNPCVVCNRDVKFKPFLEQAKKFGADFYATGHYARIVHDQDEHLLKKAVDDAKDQSYFLCQLSKDQLKNVLFPLGEFTKPEVRKIAEENNLISANTRDSYDICFLGSEKFKDFMQKNYPEADGNIVDFKTQKVVGKHTGISRYTVGQRKGLGIGGGHGKTGESWYVAEKNLKTNTIYVAQGNGEELLSSALISNKVNWLVDMGKTKEFDAFAKCRYRQSDQKVHIVIHDDNSVLVTFAQKQRAVTLGQYVVFYSEDGICLGGGTIDEIIK